ncbi:MAG: glycoside hydrolase family 9 protein [Cyanobacteria bacterium J06607_10]
MDFANFSVKESWGKGFVGNITVNNATKTLLDGWHFTLKAPFEITKIWNAEIVKKRGDIYVLRSKPANAKPLAGQTVSFGFVGKFLKSVEKSVDKDALGRFSTDIYAKENQPKFLSFNGLTPEPTFDFTAKQPKAERIDNQKHQPKAFVLATNSSGSKADSPIGTPSQTLLDHKRGGKFNYGEALQKSFLFYEAQRAGRLPDDNRIDWRDDSVLDDGKDVGLDLSGGYFDAGDNVKFGMTTAATMTLLSWGASEYRQAYRRSGQLDEAMDAIKWGTDYILNAHVAKNGRTQAFYGQVGLGELDHQYFGRVEDMKNIPRPSLKIDAKNPGSDLAAESAAALASAAVVFQSTQPSYARRLIRNAKQLYAFAKQYQGRYSDSITEAANFHKSWDDYQDELAWAATWIYKATGEKQYLKQAEALYDGVSWTQSLNHKNLGTSVLLAYERPENLQYQQDAETWLDRWVEGRNGVKYTPGGFAWAVEWGSARTAATAAFISGVYGDTVTDPQGKYAEFSTSQVDYLLGDNPNNFSYMVGFGENYARQPHHRNAAGTKDFRTSKDNRHIIYGALVGGLTAPNDDAYQDIRRDYVANEVAIAYNGGFTGALVQQYDKFGGTPLTDAQLNSLPGISVDVGPFG